MKRRLLIGFISPLLIFLIGTLIAAIYITKTTQRMDQLILLHRVELLREDLIIRIQHVQSNIILNKTRNQSDVDALLVHMQEIDKVMDSCLGCHHSPELSQGLHGMRDVANDYKSAIGGLVNASVKPVMAEARERRAQYMGQELITMAQGMAFTANVRLQKKTQEMMATLRDVSTVLYATLLFGFLLAIAISAFLAKSFDRRVESLVAAIRRISRGELEYRIPKTESAISGFRELGEAFNEMARALRRDQRQLVQSAKLTAIADLGASIAYEVNHPLNAVLGYTGHLLKSDDLPADKKEQLKTIERETLRATEITKNLQKFVNRKPLRMQKADVRAMMREVVEHVKKRQLSNIKCIMDCADPLLPVSLDADLMKQVFLHLVDSSLRQMPNGGLLTIRCKCERDMFGRDFTAIEFTDNGAGIPDPQLDKIFDPLFNTRLEGEGTSLALAMSYLIVQNHGGRIEVESKVGSGSSFRVILPM